MGKSSVNIFGNKVILRRIEEQDEEMLLGLINDPEVAKVTGGYPHPASYAHQIDWFRSGANLPGGLQRIIADRDFPQNGLGMIILSGGGAGSGKRAEIYIKLTNSARGKGYGEDAVNALVSYAFGELGLNSVYANIVEYNRASRKLFEKCGFRQESVQKSRADREGHYREVYVYEIRNEQDGDW